MEKKIIKVRKINKTKKPIIKKEAIKKAIGDITEKIKTIRVTNPFKNINILQKFRKPKVVMRKTYQKKTWKKVASMILVAIIILAIIVGIIFLVKKIKNSPRPLPKNSINTNSQEPGNVIEIDNLDENFPDNGEIISQGRFNNVEQILKGKALFVKSGGDVFLRLEGFETVNGQDMHIYLSPILNLNPEDAIDLGIMKSTTGNVNYKVEKSVDLEKYFNVLIWSNRFNAFFGYATLQKGELLPENPI
ncbi:MAG: DM13 domain-containing protein [bacterium]|nr:DM13 domain-containing protein [bacterium]